LCADAAGYSTGVSLPGWLLLSSALLAAAVALGLMARRVGIQLTVVLVMVGFGARLVGEPAGLEVPLEGEGFEEVVIFLFLPVLVFEAALGLSVRAFFANIGPILMLAVVALLVSAALVGAALNVVLGTPLAAALLFGALISATDPVAVVAVFRELGVPERLLTLVEGESLLNDGVAIVLFTILLSAALGDDVSVGAGIVDFAKVFFGGAAIGAVLGLAVAILLPWLDRNLSAALTVAVAYGGFVLADDVLGFSGVMAGVAAGIVIAGFAPSRASADTREMLEAVWEALGYIANALLFLLIGLAIEPELIVDNAGAIALAIVVVLVARAVAVVPVVSALERFARSHPVGRRNEAVLIWGGLRGGVALALALALPESLPQRDQFVAMTGGVVLATLLLNATTIGRPHPPPRPRRAEPT
jgi:CPA1 family monovalent cation:H+ antiporter